MTSIMTTSAATPVSGTSWQERLEECCRDAQLPAPTFNLCSDRRGGRTAWSSQVIIDGTCLSARYWYDHRYVNNAKEDVAEVAYNWLTGS